MADFGAGHFPGVLTAKWMLTQQPRDSENGQSLPDELGSAQSVASQLSVIAADADETALLFINGAELAGANVLSDSMELFPFRRAV
jgi:hypothetical protein